jgi:hypothetical protein
MKILLTLVMLVALTLSPLVPMSGAADPIKFGFSAPLTSPIAFIAEKAKLGTEYAVAQLNAKGGSSVGRWRSSMGTLVWTPTRQSISPVATSSRRR